jgi:uncharacterized protein YfaP (DUF2135 family)
MKQFMFFVFALAVVGMALIGLLQPQKTTGTVEMVQPCGWPWCAGYDSHYAQEVNVPNSEANQNNGEATLDNARATAVIVEAYRVENNTEVKTGVALGMCGSAFFGVFILLVGLIAMKWITR